MKNVLDVDFLIIGQGLAGSAVAIRALSRNYRILVLDEPSQNHSSLVAAGLFNPITGRNMVKSWLADDVFPELHKYYRDVERLTATRFFYPMPMYRPFLSFEEQNEWMGKSADISYRNYLADLSTSPVFGDDVKDMFGGITLKQCGYLDTGTYIHSVRRYLESRKSFQRHTFDASKLTIDEDHVSYESVRASRVIFCQGVKNNSNPWFNSLPIKSLKGEFLTVQCAWKKDVILNRGVYMLRGSGHGEWKVGATYNWNDAEPAITDWAKNELIAKLEDLIRLPYSVTGQQWGFRPTTPDRKPVMGAHPHYKTLIIFNGLGTKGVSLAPYFSAVLFRWLENKGMVNKEADVTRFI